MNEVMQVIARIDSWFDQWNASDGGTPELLAQLEELAIELTHALIRIRDEGAYKVAKGVLAKLRCTDEHGYFTKLDEGMDLLAELCTLLESEQSKEQAPTTLEQHCRTTPGTHADKAKSWLMNHPEDKRTFAQVKKACSRFPHYEPQKSD